MVDSDLIQHFYPQPSLDPDQPTPVPDSSCFFIAPPTDVKRGLGTGRLVVFVSDHESEELLDDDGESPAPDPADHQNNEQDDDDNDNCGSAHFYNVVRWRSFSFSLNTSQSAIIYKIVTIYHDIHLEWTTAELVHYDVLTPVIYDQKPKVPLLFKGSSRFSYSLESKHIIRRPINVEIYFYLTQGDMTSGEPVTIGYFKWHGTITIR
jgi:hypothetical protein